MTRVAVVLVLAVSACSTYTFVDPEELVTIERGIYGLTIGGCDTSGCEERPYDGAVVTASAPGSTTPVATTTSDADGFFELTLPAGTYSVCVHACITVTVAATDRVRKDFVSGPGGGLWCEADGTCDPGE